MNNYTLRELRLKKGLGLKDISDSIKGLSLERLCKIEDNPTSARLRVHEFLLISHMLNLTKKEEKGFLLWCTQD